MADIVTVQPFRSTVDIVEVTGVTLRQILEHSASEWHPGRLERRLPAGLGSVEGLLFIGCLTSQQHASVSQGRICSDKWTCCHTEVDVADQTFHLPQ